MKKEKRELIELMVRSKVLTFGDFTTKSGRKTPYFINTGKYETGEQIDRLGLLYANVFRFGELGNDINRVNVLFGPAYKGIPLVVAMAMSLHNDWQYEVSYCFNRKEAKDHGEGGSLIGHKLQDGDRVLIIEDVTTAGTSIRETVPLLKAAANIELAGLIVSVDRQEKGQGEKSALQEVGEEFGMSTASIVTITEIVDYLKENKVDGRMVIDDDILERIHAYWEQYLAV